MKQHVWHNPQIKTESNDMEWIQAILSWKCSQPLTENCLFFRKITSFFSPFIPLFLPPFLLPFLPSSFLHGFNISYCVNTLQFTLAILILIDHKSIFSILPLSTMLQINNYTYIRKYWWFYNCVIDFEKQVARSKSMQILIQQMLPECF